MEREREEGRGREEGRRRGRRLFKWALAKNTRAVARDSAINRRVKEKEKTRRVEGRKEK